MWIYLDLLVELCEHNFSLYLATLKVDTEGGRLIPNMLYLYYSVKIAH